MRQILLLRGVNLGARNRIAMPQLRDVLAGAGFDDVATYLQSGNVILSTSKDPPAVSRECERLIAEQFGLDIDVLVRTRDELADVVECDPLAATATNPKRYQVTFLAGEPDQATVAKISAAASSDERVVIAGREVYAWHPEGIGRSRLWTLLASKRLGLKATARNWTTIENLLQLADA